MTTDGNEPASPVTGKRYLYDADFSGLTKREEFAKAAMVGLLSRGSPLDIVADAAVKMADAFIEALNKID